MYLHRIFPLLCYAGITLYSSNCLGQSKEYANKIITSQISKPPLDTSMIYRWPMVKSPMISGNGRFVVYMIEDDYLTISRTILKDIKSNRSITWENVSQIHFTQNSKTLVFIKNDSLFFLNLENFSSSIVSAVSSFSSIFHNADEWITYIQDSTTQKLFITHPETGQSKSINNVTSYIFSGNADKIFVVSKLEDRSSTLFSVQALDFDFRNMYTIWTGNKVSTDLISSDDGNSLVFRASENADDRIWWYKFGTAKALPLKLNNPESNFVIDRLIRFSKSYNNKIFVWMKSASHTNDINVPGVTIWSYTDGSIQSEPKRDQAPLALLDLESGRLTIIQQDYDKVGDLFFRDRFDDFILLNRSEGRREDHYWNRKAITQSFLIDTKDGRCKQLPISFSSMYYIDPTRKFIVGFDGEFKDFYSYELATGKVNNLTRSINIPIKSLIQRDNDDDRPYAVDNKGFSFAGWLGHEGFLVYDEYDIWMVSLNNSSRPKCLTQAWGRENKTSLRLSQNYSENIVDIKNEVILIGYNTQNKNISFFTANLSSSKMPSLLSTGPFYYNKIENNNGERSVVVKAKYADIYIVQRQTASHSPNVFLTKDFKNFLPISTLYPEREYNWLSSELISFNTMDGRIEKAIIYKPENFSAKLKYPVIFHFYERKSQFLNKYYTPGEMNGELDIAWFVSNGYIVCCPDIHYETGEVSKSVYNSVVSVAGFLSKFPWVNPKKMGIQGHSFGGYEVNCLVTQTKMFSAAISSFGVSNLTSEYLAELRGGNMAYHEKQQVRLGKTLWERPDIYIKNSPLFKADAVVTPMLTVANKGDRNVSYAQGIQWYLALRRLGKKIWMLDYDKQNHGVEGYPYIDYLIRSTQFFNHYLKDFPAPKWMMDGNDTESYNEGFKLSAPGVTPGNGLLRNK